MFVKKFSINRQMRISFENQLFYIFIYSLFTYILYLHTVIKDFIFYHFYILIFLSN